MKKIYTWLFLLGVSATTFSQQDYPQNELGNNSTEVGVALSNFDAVRSSTGVQLQWTATEESNMQKYEIEKSANGSSFSTIGSLVAQNRASNYKYTFSDGTPAESINYYRLRSTDRLGRISVSKAIAVDNSYRKTDLQIIPNPVVGGALNLQMKNFEAGKYYVTLLANSGQRIVAQSFDISEGTAMRIINLPRGLAAGMYILQLSNGEVRMNKQVVVR